MITITEHDTPQPTPQTTWQEIRCRACGRLLGRIRTGTVEVKCPRCGKLNTVKREGE